MSEEREKKKGVSLIARTREILAASSTGSPPVFSTVITEKCGKGPAEEPYVDVGWGSACMCHQEIRCPVRAPLTEAYYSTIVQSAQ